MVRVLESHLAPHEQEAVADSTVPLSDRASALSDVISFHVSLFEALDRRLGTEGLSEAHRPLVPLFQRWLITARRMATAARELIAQGQLVVGLNDLARAMNRAKPTAEHFDYYVETNDRIARGEPIHYTPLNEVLNELRR